MAGMRKDVKLGVMRNNVTDSHEELAVNGRGEAEVGIQVMPRRTGCATSPSWSIGNLISPNPGMPPGQGPLQA